MKFQTLFKLLFKFLLFPSVLTDCKVLRTVATRTDANLHRPWNVQIQY